MTDNATATRPLIEISTAHLTQADAQRLESERELATPGIRLMDDEYGFFLAVPPADHPYGVEQCPESVGRCLAWAREQGAAFLLIDRDAEEVADLPSYEW